MCVVASCDIFLKYSFLVSKLIWGMYARIWCYHKQLQNCGVTFSPACRLVTEGSYNFDVNDTILRTELRRKNDDNDICIIKKCTLRGIDLTLKCRVNFTEVIFPSNIILKPDYFIVSEIFSIIIFSLQTNL
jgi:hypothetical protein